MIWARKEFYLSIFRLLDDFCLLLSKEFSESFACDTRSSLMWPWPVRMVSHWRLTKWSWLRWILVQNILTHQSELEDSSSAKKNISKAFAPGLGLWFLFIQQKGFLSNSCPNHPHPSIKKYQKLAYIRCARAIFAIFMCWRFRHFWQSYHSWQFWYLKTPDNFEIFNSCKIWQFWHF